MPDISLDEWLAELERLSKRAEGGGITTQELCEATGRGVGWVRRRLHQAQRQGRLEVVRVYRTAIDGVPRHVPAYRLGKPAP